MSGSILRIETVGGRHARTRSIKWRERFPVSSGCVSKSNIIGRVLQQHFLFYSTICTLYTMDRLLFTRWFLFTVIIIVEITKWIVRKTKGNRTLWEKDILGMRNKNLFLTNSSFVLLHITQVL